MTGEIVDINWDRPIDRYLAERLPESIVVSVEEYELIWNVYHKLRGSYHQLHISKAMLKDWEQRQNRKSA